jgi:hypothetical protein
MGVHHIHPQYELVEMKMRNKKMNLHMTSFRD